MKQRTRKKGLLKRFKSPLRRGLVAASVAMMVIPEPVTTAIGAAVLGVCLTVPERQKAVKLAACGASARRGNLNYGHGFA